MGRKIKEFMFSSVFEISRPNNIDVNCIRIAIVRSWYSSTNCLLSSAVPHTSYSTKKAIWRYNIYILVSNAFSSSSLYPEFTTNSLFLGSGCLYWFSETLNNVWMSACLRCFKCRLPWQCIVFTVLLCYSVCVDYSQRLNCKVTFYEKMTLRNNAKLKG